MAAALTGVERDRARGELEAMGKPLRPRVAPIVGEMRQGKKGMCQAIVGIERDGALEMARAPDIGVGAIVGERSIPRSTQS